MIDRRTGHYAIVGIGCRFPGGANSADAFWTMLAEGRDAIGPVPDDRPDWAALYDPDPGATGRIYARLGGFIDDIDKFDARFFGISPREAVHIDPQHRFLLETVWQAFEDARIPLDRLAGSDTGVFVGISTHDYGDVQMDPRYHDRIAVHTNSGCATSIAANRISFTYDLRGPSMAVDTACSSALTATHLACTALDAGDCSMAVVAGVQLLLRPELTMGFCRATMLSVDGHCKAFDAAGNGYVRAEGAGVVVLKPLDAALADGDPIHAVILGTAVNQDGRTSSLTIPTEVSQRAMLRTALDRAGVDPSMVQYVEAHGPGTAVGDPIEARAIGAVFGPGRPDDRPLLVGSVKTNIGHLEAGSGIAGLIKAALAVSHRQVPPSLHFHEWNPAIDPAAL
jgi:acyl transferase domain-containing protein